MSNMDRSLRVARATRAQIPEIVDLWVEFIQYHEDMMPDFAMSSNASKEFRKYIESLFAKRDRRLLVATDGDAVVGYALLAINKRPPIFEMLKYGMICDAFVTERYRRNGIGKMLLDESLAWFRKKGLSRVELVVATGNKIGCSFWKRTGFAEHAKKMHLML